MFNYYESRKELKNLRNKIYKKQQKLFNIMHKQKIFFDDTSIKKYVSEINLLEEIFDIKKIYFDYDSKIYWNEANSL